MTWSDVMLVNGEGVEQLVMKGVAFLIYLKIIIIYEQKMKEREIKNIQRE